MDPLVALALCLACVVGTAIICAVVACRYYGTHHQAGSADHRLIEHAAYCRGFDACSRIRDRQEAQERKAALLRPCPESSSSRGGVEDTRSVGL